MTATNDQGLTFDIWYSKVDRICTRAAGIGIEDLADGPSYDCWADGYSPAEYVTERLEEEGFPFQ